MLRSKASFGAQQKHKWCAANCLKVKLETGFGKDARKSGISDVFACLSIRRYCLGQRLLMFGVNISDVWDDGFAAGGKVALTRGFGR